MGFQHAVLVTALVESCSTQQTLSFVSFKSRTSGAFSKNRKKAAHLGLSTQEQTLRAIVKRKLGKYAYVNSSLPLLTLAVYTDACIRVNPDVLALFNRINLIYFRLYVFFPPTARLSHIETIRHIRFILQNPVCHGNPHRRDPNRLQEKGLRVLHTSTHHGNLVLSFSPLIVPEGA